LRLRLCGLRLRLRRRRPLETEFSLPNWWTNLWKKSSPVDGLPKTGVYHFLWQSGQEKARMHLRVDADGSGVLMVNASRIYHFNPTAAAMAYWALNQTDHQQAVNNLSRCYNVDHTTAEQDYSQFEQQIERIVHPDGSCPVCDLGMDIVAPFTTVPSSPYRMDLAVTYRCNNNCRHCYNARSRAFPEMPPEKWFEVLDRLWDIGIPHIVFTGGEPTLYRHLPDLIAHAEKNGQITGINTNARQLKNKDYVQQLIDAGLDHVQITLESHIPSIHDTMVASQGAWEDTVQGLENVIDSSLFVMTNTTLLRNNAAYLQDTLTFLESKKVPTIGLNALIYSGKGKAVDTGLREQELIPLLEIARAHTARSGQRLIWYTPTEYCHFDPVLLELGVKGCTAALYNMCIEPDGSVLPCQSYYQSLGSILENSWDSIWNHDLAVSLRERRNLPEKCHACELLAECGGGCPLAREAHSQEEPQLISVA
jgi:radical SAM protein with 4Fe4S-binding SPASM domain